MCSPTISAYAVHEVVSCMLYGARCMLCVVCHLPERQRVQPDDQRVRRVQRSRDRRLPLPPKSCNTTHNLHMSYIARTGWASAHAHAHARMHAGAQLLLPVEWIGRVCDRHDRIDNLCLPIRDGAPTVEHTPLIRSSKPPTQSTRQRSARRAEKQTSEAVRATRRANSVSAIRCALWRTGGEQSVAH